MEQENKDKSTCFDLKTDAIDALVNGDPEQVPEYSEEEIKKYRKTKGFHLPDWLKVIGIKAWFYGAICFFIMWGLGMYISSNLDMLFILGAVLGMVTDLLINNAIRFFESVPGGNDKWLVFPPKKMTSFGLNLLYGFVLVFLVFAFYELINTAIMVITEVEDTTFLGVEPVIFGLLCMGFDMLFVGMKRLICGIIRDAKAAAHPEK